MASFLRIIKSIISRSCNSPKWPMIPHACNPSISPPPPPLSSSLPMIPHSLYPPILPSPLPSSMPLLMYPLRRDNTVSRFYSPADNTFVELPQTVFHKFIDSKPIAIGPCSRSSLAYISARDSYLFVYNPFLQSLVFLPWFETLADQQLTKPAKFIKKLIFTWDKPELEAEERLCLAIYGDEKKVGFCRQGDTKWTALKVLHGYRYDDFVHYKDQIYYALVSTASRNLIERWDLSGICDSPCNFLKRTELKADYLGTPDHFNEQEMRQRNHCAAKRYLVKNEGDILMVVRYFCKNDHITHLFTVYWLDFETNSLKNLQNIGDYTLFVGANRSAFFLDPSSYPGLKKNSIYFSNDKIEETENHETFVYNVSSSDKSNEKVFTKDCHDYGIFDLEDKTIKYCCYPLGSDKTHPPPVWVVSP